VADARKMAPKTVRHDFDTVAIFVHRLIWKERNSRIFEQELSMVDKVFELTIEEMRVWRAARLAA
jgi:hypothetical protein